MQELPLLNQIFFWQGNRLYQLILKDKKIYGVYLEGQFHAFTWLSFAYHLLSLSLSLLLTLMILFVLPANISSFIFANSLDFIFFFLIIAVFQNLISRSRFYEIMMKKVQVKRQAKRQLIIDEAKNMIKSNEQSAFIKIYKKNFVLELDKLDKAEVLSDQFIWMWPEKHFGQLKFSLKDGSEKHFVLSEPKYTELKIICENLV